MSRAALDVERLVAYLERRYRHDERGRLALAADVPRFLFARSREGCVWRFREDLMADAVRDLSRLAGREAPPNAIDPVADPPLRLEPMRRVLDAPPPQGETLGDPECFADLYRFA